MNRPGGPPARTMPPWLHAALGMPRLLYTHGFGPILGSRFLLLTHTGRRSGRRYDTVLEIVHRDRATGEYVVVAGFGRDADWYRNVHSGSPAQITIGRTRSEVRARDLDLEEAVAVLGVYERRNRLIAPVVHLVLSRLVGWRYRGTPIDRWRLAQVLPLVALRPE